MELFGFLWQIFAFIIMIIFEKLANVADEIMFTLEDYEVYDSIFRFLSSCLGNYYFWKMVATIGFYQYLRRLADKFPPNSIIAIEVDLVDAGPSMQQLLEEKETGLKDAASKVDNLDKDNAGLRTKVDRLQREVDFISKDRYALVRENCILQNKLGDFNSWPEFRVEYDQLATEFEAMKRQRAREHISHEQILHIAKETKLELAAAKRAEAMSKIAHSEELKLVEQERDEAKEKYQTLLATTAAAAEGNSPGDKVLQGENTRLTLALHSQTSLLAKSSSDLDRMKFLLKTRSNHSASQLETATSTILSLEEEKKQAEKRIVELEKDVQDANEKAEEMEEMYMAVTFMDEGEGGKEEEDEEEVEERDDEDDEDDEEDEDDGDNESEEDNEEEDTDNGDGKDEEGDKNFHDENED